MAPRNKPAATGTAVAEAPKQEVVAAEHGTIPGIKKITDAAALAELDGVVGAGVSDNVNDKGIPLLYTAQKGSPRIDKKKDKFIEGLEVGDLFNTLTGEFFKAEADGLEALPCFYRVNYVEWLPEREGFVASHPRDTDLLKTAKMFVHPETGKTRGDMFVLPNGNMLVETHNYFCVLPHNYTTIMIPMSGTNLGASRIWQSLMDAQKLELPTGFVVQPGFWSRYLLKTVYRDDGTYQWYQIRPSLLGDNDDPKLKAFCKAFALACKKGDVEVSAPPAEGGGQQADDSDAPI